MPTNKTLKQFIENCPHKEICLCHTCAANTRCLICYRMGEYKEILFKEDCSNKECFNYETKEKI